MKKIKDKYIDIVKSRVDICQLIVDLCPEVVLKPAGPHRKRCCCVFHQEKTPSMILDVTMNRYKCFGCGKSGDVLSFVEECQGLGFTDSVRYLLDMYCPDIDSKDMFEQCTPEMEDNYRKMETMYIYNQYAWEFFRSQYEANSIEAKACRDYAELSGDKSVGRWDATFCQTFGLGYSPLRGNQFVQFAKKKGLNFEILVQMGLICEDENNPGRHFDFYRGRLMIPQRDRYGRVQTFTARSINSQATIKYLNGRDCQIYKKSTSIFGIDIALKAARQSGKVYLVEGAPDVMRLQSLGIANVVASLGGCWTKEQFEYFNNFSCSLCFIPDQDVPKEGERFGAGEKFVFNNGRLAIEMGFQVTVREIPFDGKTKQDADSYITDMERWEAMTEKHFILWYAAKQYNTKGTNDDQLKVINDLCDLLVNVESESLQTSLLSELKEKFGRATIWKSGITDATRRRHEHIKRLAIKKSSELEGFGFYRKGYHYYDLDPQGRSRDWTNFIIRPLFLIADNNKPSRIFELENESRCKRTIELLQMDVTKLDRFKEKIEGKGDFRFFERQDKYELLKAYMYGKTEEAQRITQMGWNNIGEKGFYAFCNGIIYDGKWIPVDEYGIVRLDSENFYLPATSKLYKRNKSAFINERRFMHAPKREVSAKEYFTLLYELYGNNGVVAICFYLATLFKDIITDSTRSFPVLNIYGKKGTGKTEFAISLISLFQHNPEISNLDSTTYYAMGDKCAEVCNMLVHFDEYKNSLSRKHIDFLKGIYDRAGRLKRSSDGERRESTEVSCGVILTGQEMPTADVALLSRVIFLESQKSERTKEETDKYQQFMKLRNMYPTNITVEMMKYRGNFNAGWHTAWERALTEIKNDVNYNVIGERFINNWAMMLATYYCLHPYVQDLPFSEEQVHDICIEGLKYQHSLCNNSDEIAVFWSMFSKARQLGDIKEGQDYKICHVNNLKVSVKGDPRKDVEFDMPKNILFVREKICIAKANIQAKKEGKIMIPDESLLSYLMSTPDYYGKTRSPFKFYVLDEAGKQMKRVKENGDSELLYDQERVLAFDYEGVCGNYDINLHILAERISTQHPDGLHKKEVMSYGREE